MAKQTVNPGTAPTGVGGDTFRSGSAKLQANDDEIYNYLGDGTNLNKLGTAAFKNAGTDAGNLMEVGAFGLGLKSNTTYISPTSDLSNFPNGLYALENGGHSGILIRQAGVQGISKLGVFGFPSDRATSAPFYYQMDLADGKTFTEQATIGRKHVFRTTQNTAIDANGFIKNASPIVKLFANQIELNAEAVEQEITFEKVDVGDYLIKDSSGFAQEGWYIETPKDANGNVLFSVIYTTLENGDISVKTYKKKFDLETASIIADLNSPVDITEGRWIDLRLQEFPQEVIHDPEQ